MPERIKEGEEFPPNEAIANVMHDWLVAEIEDFSEGRNKVLDDWQAFRQNSLAKNAGHYDRLKLRTKDILANGSMDSEDAALQIFDTLMGLSGAFRTQCWLMNENEGDYKQMRRNDGPLGIDIDGHVRYRLHQHFGVNPWVEDLSQPAIELEELLARTHDVNDLRFETHEKIHRNKKSKEGMRKVLNRSRLLDIQGAWLNLGVDYILCTAQARNGDLAGMPMMEPKSITDAKIYYPFDKK